MKIRIRENGCFPPPDSEDILKSLLNDQRKEDLNQGKKMNSAFEIEPDSHLFLLLVLMILLPLLYLLIRNCLESCCFLCQNKQKNDENGQLITDQHESHSNGNNNTENETIDKTNKSICGKLKRLWKFLEIFMKLLVVILPSIFVILIQYWCIYHFWNTDFDVVSLDDLFVLKYLISLVFVFIICTKCSKILNAILLFSMSIYTQLNYSLIFKIPFVFLVLTPYFSAFFLGWIIAYYTILYLVSQGDLFDVIQSFAGFFVLMEFSKIMVSFLRSINFDKFFNRLINEDETRDLIKLMFKNFRFRKAFRMILNEDDFSMEDFQADFKEDEIVMVYFGYFKSLVILCAIGVVHYFMWTNCKTLIY